MNEQKKVWIYGRINKPNKNELLCYQMDFLTKYAHENNYAIVDSTRTFDSRKSLKSIFMHYLINSIASEFMNCISVYSTNRLLIDPDKLEKLKLICRMYNASIITFK